MDRRRFLATSVGALGIGPGFMRAALAGPAQNGAGPYGALLAPDANGVALPAGFRSRVIAVSGQPIGPRGYVWHRAPDGAACFPQPDGGWVVAVNAETTPGGVGALRFDRDGEVVDAYRILDGTRNNCAGGATPWGTWLSCEETSGGLVYECDVTTPGQGVVRPAMGAFNHEAVAVDPVRQRLYLTEDAATGHYYRFTPANYPNLSSGTLEAALVLPDGAVRWLPIPRPDLPLAVQAIAATRFNGGEGIHHDPAQGGFVYFTTKGDNHVWAHDLTRETITALYEGDGQLTGVDNILVAPSGDLLVAEDGGNLELIVIAADTRQLAPFLRLPTGADSGSEITGPCFSPDGTRLYFNSQRGGIGQAGTGVTYEITGPFRIERVGVAALGTGGIPAPL